MNAESSPVVGPAATALAAPSETGAPRPDTPAPAEVDTAAFPGPVAAVATATGTTTGTMSGAETGMEPLPATLADVIRGPVRSGDTASADPDQDAGPGDTAGRGPRRGSSSAPTMRAALAAALGITRISGGRRSAASRSAAAWWNASPTHLVLARRIEPGLAASLTLTAALATPAAARLLGGDVLGVPLEPSLAQTPAQLAVTWFPAAAGALVTLLATVRLCTVGWLILRGAVLLSTAAAMASLTPSRSPVALVWVLAVAASYPFLLPRAAGRAVVSAAMTALAVPLLAQAARSGAADPVGALLGTTAADGTGRSGTPASTLTLLGGMAVVASLGSAAAATRSTLRATAHLAIRRTRDAEQASAALDRASTRDDLTGLPNRATLLRETVMALAQADVAGGQVGMLVIGLGRIGLGRGPLREGIGTDLEDELVRQIGRRLRAARPAGETVARIGEHRFAVMIPGMASDGGAATARRLAALIEEPVNAGDRVVTVNGSIGIAVSGAGLDTAEELVRSAEEAMRSAERGGRTPWAVFDRAMRAHSESQAVLEVQLREAIEQGTISAAFQPIVPALWAGSTGPDATGSGTEAAARRPVAVEALARWTRPDGTAVTPQRFLPMAEELGLGGELGMLVLDRALTAWERWQASIGGTGSEGLRVSVNAGPSQLLDPEYAHQVSARLGARGIPPEALMVEISASGYRDGEQARSNLGMLRSLGVEIALDDFGRDGTSLATLRQLPIGTVKLDHRLSIDLGRSDAVVRAVVAMCHELGMRVVAEGIETRTQLEAAQRLGVDAVQGFLVGIPGRAEDALPRQTLH